MKPGASFVLASAKRVKTKYEDGEGIGEGCFASASFAKYGEAMHEMARKQSTRLPSQAEVMTK